MNRLLVLCLLIGCTAAKAEPIDMRNFGHLLHGVTRAQFLKACVANEGTHKPYDGFDHCRFWDRFVVTAHFRDHRRAKANLVGHSYMGNEGAIETYKFAIETFGKPAQVTMKDDCTNWLWLGIDAGKLWLDVGKDDGLLLRVCPDRFQVFVGGLND